MAEPTNDWLVQRKKGGNLVKNDDCQVNSKIGKSSAPVATSNRFANLDNSKTKKHGVANSPTTWARTVSCSQQKSTDFQLDSESVGIRKYEKEFRAIRQLVEKRKGRDGNFRNIHNVTYIYEILSQFSDLMFEALTGFTFKAEQPGESLKIKCLYVYYKWDKVETSRRPRSFKVFCQFVNENGRTSEREISRDLQKKYFFKKLRNDYHFMLFEMIYCLCIHKKSPFVKALVQVYNNNIHSILFEMARTFYCHTEHFQRVRYLGIFACEVILEHLPVGEIIEADEAFKRAKRSILTFFIHFLPYTNEEFRRRKFISVLMNMDSEQPVQSFDPRTFAKHYGHSKDMDAYAVPIFPTSWKMFFSAEMNRVGSLSFTKDVFWTPVSDVAVLTGKNGSGKTSVLNFIHSKLKSRGIAHLYVDSEATMLRNVFGQNGSDFKYEFVREALRWYFDLSDTKQREVVFSKKSLDTNINYKIALSIIDRFLCRDYSHISTNSELRNVSDDEIREAGELLAFTEGSIKEPISFVRNLCWQFFSRVVTQQNGWLQLLEVSKQFSESMRTDMDIENFEKDVNRIYKDICQCYFDEHQDSSPVTELNSLFSKYCLEFSIGYGWVSNKSNFNVVECDDFSDGFELLFYKYKNRIAIHELSSGELVVIKLLLWSYVSKGLDFTKRQQESYSSLKCKLSVVLLDEVDKHFDPRLSRVLMEVLRNEFKSGEHNVQVFMTTHRLDTLAQVTDDELYLVEMKGDNLLTFSPHIKPCTKLAAIAKLSQNIQRYIGMHIRVYTESFDDAKFYEAIYANLMKINDRVRKLLNDGTQKELDSILKEVATLSRRYQMGFYSASLEDGEGGGYSEVCKMVVRGRIYTERKDNAIYNPASFVANILRSYNVDAPFGLIDKDYKDHRSEIIPSDKANAKTAISNAKTAISILDGVVQLQRHSLENFLFDPLLLCSVLSLQQLRRLESENLNPAFVNLREALDARDPETIRSKVHDAFMAMFKEYVDFEIECTNLESFLQSMTKMGLKNTGKGSKKKSSSKAVTEGEKVIPPTLRLPLRVIAEGLRGISKEPTKKLLVERLSAYGAYSATEIMQSIHQGKFAIPSRWNFTKEGELKNFIAVEEAMKEAMNGRFKSSKRISVLFGANVLVVDYPEIFLTARGHNFEYIMKPSLEKVFAGSELSVHVNLVDLLLLKSNMTKDQETLFGTALIPCDLLDTILVLNRKIKCQIIQKADKVKYDSYLTNQEMATSKGYSIRASEEETINLLAKYQRQLDEEEAKMR